MSDETIPTCEQLFDCIDVEEVEEGLDFVCVNQETIEPWRHGTLESAVFRRVSDGTFWAAYYRVGTDGETHELRDGCAQIEQVWPHQVVAVLYKNERPEIQS